MPDRKKTRESTLAFNFDEAAFERAGESPTYYQALKAAPKQAHPFLLYDGILSQPQLVSTTLETTGHVVRRIAHMLVKRRIRRVILSGIGSSYNLALAGVHAFGQLSALPAEAVESSESLESQVVFDYSDTVVLGLSASGNTVETVRHLHAARRAGAITIAVVNVDDTRLTAAAHETIVAAGGFGLGWDFTTRLAAIYLLAIELGEALGQSTDLLYSAKLSLLDCPTHMQEVLEDVDIRCQVIANALRDLRALVIAASGNQLALAAEMALRMEEVAHFPARGRSLVDFLHGGVGYLSSEIGTIVLAPNSETAYKHAVRVAKITSLVKTPCIALLDEHDSKIALWADYVVRVKSVHAVISPLLYIIPTQLIPYYVESFRPGGNPDTQRTDQPRYARAFDCAYPPKSH